MAWIRLSDDYNDHPKFTRLSDGAFRLWHQAMGFCRKFQTDGMVDAASLRLLTHYSVKRMTELLTPWKPDANPLWTTVDGFGIKVHDYLQWNPSKDEENERRVSSRDRMRQARLPRKTDDGSLVVASSVRANNTQTSERTSCEVPGWDGSRSDLSEKEDDDIGTRAGRLLQELYPAWYREHRNGARLRIVANSLAHQDAIAVCATWDDARIEKLARIFLTTDDDWIAKTDRGFRLFASKATWSRRIG